MSSKTLAIVGLIALFGNRLTTCRSPGEGGGDANQPAREKVVELKGVDTASLTARERADWSAAVSELLTPCADQPVSLAQCVNESRSCRACLPAARYLADQVRRGRTRSQVDAAYRARFAPEQVKNIEIGDAPSKGPSGAPVLVVEFADFECPACGSVRPVLDQLMQKNPDKVRLVFKHFPLSMHPNAEKAARAAVAAQRQGKFWEMHTVLFENQAQLNVENVEKLAQKIGLDLARFRQDRDSEATADFVNRDRKQGEALELQSTPSLFINGRMFQNGGGEFPQELDDWVGLELELLGASPSPSAPAASAPAASATAPAASASVAAPASAVAAPPAASSSARPASPTAPPGASGAARPTSSAAAPPVSASAKKP